MSSIKANNIKFSVSGEYSSSNDIIFNLDVKKNDYSGIGTLSGQITERGVGKKGIVKILFNPQNDFDYSKFEIVDIIETASDGTWQLTGVNESFTYDIIYTLDGWQDRTLTKVKPIILSNDIEISGNTIITDITPSGVAEYGKLFKYLKLSILATPGSTLAITEIIVNNNVYPINYSASAQNSQYTIDSAFDRSYVTYWLTGSGGGQLPVDIFMEFQEAIPIYMLSLYKRENANYHPSEIMLYGSNDNNTWELITHATNINTTINTHLPL